MLLLYNMSEKYFACKELAPTNLTKTSKHPVYVAYYIFTPNLKVSKEVIYQHKKLLYLHHSTTALQNP